MAATYPQPYKVKPYDVRRFQVSLLNHQVCRLPVGTRIHDTAQSSSLHALWLMVAGFEPATQRLYQLSYTIKYTDWLAATGI